MTRDRSSRELTLAEFDWPFQTDLDEDNRWVFLAEHIQWDALAQAHHGALRQAIATEALRRGTEDDSLRLPHEATLEFAAVTRVEASDGLLLLSPEDARREAEEFLSQFDVRYPTEALVRTAMRGAAA